jgi:hypothetical protein
MSFSAFFAGEWPVFSGLTSKFLQGLLEKYLGTYFKGLPKAVVTQDGEEHCLRFGPLEVRPEAFLHSDNPVEVKAGHVRSLRVQLPRLSELAAGGAVTVHIDCVLLLLSLPVRREWNSEQQEQEAVSKRARHQAAIAAAEHLLKDLELDLQVQKRRAASKSVKGFGSFLRQARRSPRAARLLRAARPLRLARRARARRRTR